VKGGEERTERGKERDLIEREKERASKRTRQSKSAQ